MRIKRKIRATPAVGESDDTSAGNDLFAEMLRAFGPSGGLVHEAEVFASRCRTRSSGVLGDILFGSLICFEWSGCFWLPQFQFADDMSLRPGLNLVIDELSSVYDGWALALWFSRRNARLCNERPCDVAETCLSSVLEAARADRHDACS